MTCCLVTKMFWIFFIENGSNTVVPCAKFQNHWTTDTDVMDEWDDARFEFQVSFGRIIFIVQWPVYSKPPQRQVPFHSVKKCPYVDIGGFWPLCWLEVYIMSSWEKLALHRLMFYLFSWQPRKMPREPDITVYLTINCRQCMPCLYNIQKNIIARLHVITILIHGVSGREADATNLVPYQLIFPYN